MYGLSDGTCSSTVYSPASSNADSGTLRSGNRRRMAITDSTPIARQNNPGTVVARMFIASPVLSSYKPDIIRFGGVPMSVHTPPMPEA